MGLTDPVASAVDEAVRVVRELVAAPRSIPNKEEP
jgi:hypothetical protein